MPELAVNPNSQVPVIESNSSQNLPSGDAPSFDPSKDQMVSASNFELLKQQAPEVYKSLKKSVLDSVIRDMHKRAEKSHQQRKEQENGI